MAMNDSLTERPIFPRQFTLRQLFAGFTMICLLFSAIQVHVSLYSRAWRLEQEAVQKIEEHGGISRQEAIQADWLVPDMPAGVKSNSRTKNSPRK